MFFSPAFQHAWASPKIPPRSGGTPKPPRTKISRSRPRLRYARAKTECSGFATIIPTNHNSCYRARLLFMSVLKQPACIAIALISLWFSTEPSQASRRAPIPTTLCEVLSQPTGWDNKLISVSASYFNGGGPGGPVIADDRCEAGVVDVTFANHGGAERYLESSIPTDSLGTFDLCVQAIWTGRFHADYGSLTRLSWTSKESRTFRLRLLIS